MQCNSWKLYECPIYKRRNENFTHPYKKIGCLKKEHKPHFFDLTDGNLTEFSSK